MDKDNRALFNILCAILIALMLGLVAQCQSYAHEKEMTDKGCIEKLEGTFHIWDCTKGKQ